MRATSVGKSVLRNIVGTYQNRSSLETFYGDNLISKNFKILSLAKSFLIETQDYSLESRTVPNSIIDDFIKKFRNSCRDIWKISRKTYVVELSFDKIAILKSTACYRTIGLHQIPL